MLKAMSMSMQQEEMSECDWIWRFIDTLTTEDKY